jgi:hypothetical protein
MLDKKDKEWVEITFGRFAKVIDEENRSRLRPLVEIQQHQVKKIEAISEKLDDLDKRNTLEHLQILSKIDQIKKMENEDIQMLAGDIEKIKRKIPNLA